MAKVQKEQNGGKVEVFRVFDNVPLCAIRKASNADAKLPARHHRVSERRTRTEDTCATKCVFTRFMTVKIGVWKRRTRKIWGSSKLSAPGWVICTTVVHDVQVIT